MNIHHPAPVRRPIGAQLREALPVALRKLDPREVAASPVMLVVEIGAVVTTVMSVFDPSTLAIGVSIWLWLTVLFGTLAESVAEGRGKAQAKSLRALQQETTARRRRPDGSEEQVASTALRAGDVVIVEAGERIPGDGDVIEGVASVDESAVTGESAPVIRESGGDRSAVTGGTVVLSDRIVVRITSEPGQSFVDRMIALVEGSERQRTPNEIALNILLAFLTAIFVVVVGTLYYYADYSDAAPVLDRADRAAGLPDPDHHRGAALGDRHRRDGPAGPPQRAGHVRPRGRGGRRRRRTAARQDRHHHATATGRRPSCCRSPASRRSELAEAALLSSLADETPEGRVDRRPGRRCAGRCRPARHSSSSPPPPG